MKNAIIAMVGMFILMGPAGGFVSLCMQTLFGRGPEQSFVYPIYVGIIVLTGIVVGAATMIYRKIEELEKEMDTKKD